MTLWAFDIETVSWDTFLLGAAVADDGRVEAFRDVESVRDWYMQTGPGDVVLSHNGGRFDFLFLLDAVRAPWMATLAGSGIVSMRVKGHAECRDTYRFAPLSLQVWGETKADGSLRPSAKWKRVLPCICPEDCPGYCSFRLDMPRADYEKVLEYCIADARLLLEVWQEYMQRLDAAGVSVYTEKRVARRTIGGIAWATIEALECDVGDVPDFPTYDAELAAYYGGRVEVYAVHAPRVFSYDVNSMYTWGLRQGMPHGVGTLLHTETAATKAFAAQRPGLYKALVDVEPGRFALVPRRASDGAVIWATGAAEGWYTEPELRAARERGAKVRVLSARVYKRTRAVYAPWVNLAHGMRVAAGKKGDRSMYAYAKWLCNSATGKLAQGCESETLYVGPSDEQLARWMARRAADRPRWLGADAWVDTTRRGVPDSARPAHAAYLISLARGLLLDGLTAADADALYCDTDNVKARRAMGELHVDPMRLGAWKDEGNHADWRAWAPKLYRYGEGAGTRVRAKGIPLPSRGKGERARAVADALDRGEDIPLNRGVEGVRRAFGTDEARAFVRKDSHRGLRNDRRVAGLRYILDDGTTVSPHRHENGQYEWPGVRDLPRDVTRRLRDGA